LRPPSGPEMQPRLSCVVVDNCITVFAFFTTGEKAAADDNVNETMNFFIINKLV